MKKNKKLTKILADSKELSLGFFLHEEWMK
jgi:hypothetical protein